MLAIADKLKKEMLQGNPLQHNVHSRGWRWLRYPQPLLNECASIIGECLLLRDPYTRFVPPDLS